MIAPSSSPARYLVEALPTVDEGALEVLRPQDYGTLRTSDAALFLDGQMRLLAAGRAVLDLRLGLLLEPLVKGGHDALGYTSLEDYCRETLGIGKRTAVNLVARARELEGRPVLRRALVRGEISACQASLLLRFLRHDSRDAEWVTKARSLTVRGLEEALKEAQAAGGLEPVEAGLAGEGAGTTDSAATGFGAGPGDSAAAQGPASAVEAPLQEARAEGGRESVEAAVT